MVLWFLIITSCNIIFRYKTSEETYRVWDFFQPSYLLTFKVCYDLFFIEKTHSSPNTLWKQCSLNVSTFTCTQNIWYRKKICFRVTKNVIFYFGRNVLMSQQMFPVCTLRNCPIWENIVSATMFSRLQDLNTVVKFSDVWEYGMVCSDIIYMKRKEKKVLKSILIVAFSD